VGVKPILVFINTKSGPQKGWKLRRKFVRLLNPLQVPRCPELRAVSDTLQQSVIALRLHQLSRICGVWRTSATQALLLKFVQCYCVKQPLMTFIIEKFSNENHQVVELPRERPEPALELFWDVPDMRLLVVGGDGTVGWILSCLDRIVQQKDEGAATGWQQPPIAILPLGTGSRLHSRRGA
jgi:hypothetical protein